jgi:peptidylprolyl isomerase
MRKLLSIAALGLAGLLVASGCSVAAPPTPTAAPKPPAAVASAPPSAPASSASPAATTRKSYNGAPTMQIDPNKQYAATLQTSVGDMKAELYAKDTPNTVNNFVFLAREHFYDGVRFHRIIKSFMVQTGDPRGNGTGDAGYKFPDEKVTRKYERGTLAMANSGPNTNGSQFFIVHQDYPLPPNYVIFGKVTGGLDILDKIADTPVSADPRSGEKSIPQQEVTFKTITIAEQ